MNKTGEFNMTAFGLSESDLTYPEVSRLVKTVENPCARHGKAFQMLSTVRDRDTGRVQLQVNPLPSEINPETIVFPVLVTGTMKSGKSYLCNRLLDLSDDEGFKVNNSINQLTEGIWGCIDSASLRTSSIPSPVRIMYLDCESLQSNSCTLKDNLIFAIGMRVCSLLLLNT